MDLTISEHGQMLADTLGRYLRERYPIDVRHAISGSEAGWSAEQWSALADLGIVGALFAEEAGGFGGSGFDIGVVFEQLGKALVVEPFLGTLMAGRVLAKAGGHEALLEEAIAGAAPLALALEEPQSHYDLAAVDTHAERRSDGWALTGSKAVIPQAAAAGHILVSARTTTRDESEADIAVFLVAGDAPGLTIRDYPMIDGGRGGELLMADVPATLVAEDALPLIEDAVAAGIVALAWEAVGIMDQMKASMLDYLRTRKQFGVPIGKFQALQHRMATLALEIEQSRSAAINAAAALDEDRPARERAASAAKFTIGRVGTIVAEETIQMHGGIGMTWELPLSHFGKRLVMIGHQLGDDDHHLARFSELSRV